MNYIKTLHTCDDRCELPVFLNIGVHKTAMAMLDEETENMRTLFFDLSESVSIPTAVFVSDRSEYFFGSSAILAADSGYEGLLFVHFADDLSLIEKCAVPEYGANTQSITNKSLIDAFLKHIVTLLKTPELCVINRIRSTQLLRLFVTVGNIFDKNSAFYYFHSTLPQNEQNGIQISFVDVKKSFLTSDEIGSAVGIHQGKLWQIDTQISDFESLGDIFSAKLVIKTFLQYLYNEKKGKIPSDIISYDCFCLEDLIEKLEGIAGQQTRASKTITVFADGEEEILLLRQSDKDYFDLQMPISFGSTCINGFVQARNFVRSLIERTLKHKKRAIIVPDEYAPIFKPQANNVDVCSELDFLSLMVSEYRHENEILKKAIASVENFRREIHVSLMDHYQCKEAFACYSMEIKRDIIVPAVHDWGTQKADRSLQQLSSDIDKQVSDRFCYSINGGMIEAVLLDLKKNKRVYNVVEMCMESCLISVFGDQRYYSKDVGNIFSITDSYFDDWQASVLQIPSIMTYIVRAKGFFDFSNDNLPINISKRSAISNRFINNIDSYCKKYFETFDVDMPNSLSKQIFVPMVDDLCSYTTEQYKLCLETIISVDGEATRSCSHQCTDEKKEGFRVSNKTQHIAIAAEEQAQKQICSVCGAIVNGKFCGICGTKYVAPEVTKKCQNCGAVGNGNFCGKCGTKY